MTSPEAKRAFGGRLTTLRHDGLAFDVFDQGPLDGEVVVLLHGFPERSTCWRDVAPQLHAAGFRTVAMDQRGYSPRARPRRRRDHTVTHLSDDVAALIDAVGGPVHLVGHDWGAIVSWVVAQRFPERLRSLTAVSVPHPTAYLRSTVTSRQFFKSWYVLAFQIPRVAEWLASRHGGFMEKLLRTSGWSPAEVDRFRTEIVEYGAMRGGLSWYRAIPFADRALLATKVGVPTTFVWSDGDNFVGRESCERNEEYVTGTYEFVTLAGVSHWIPTQAPDACAEAILERITA